MSGLFGLPASAIPAGRKVLDDLTRGYGSAYQQPGLLETGNIDLNNRPVVHNPDGSISTVRSMSANFDGAEYLLPMVSADGRMLTEDQAIEAFLRSGQHLGAFDTPEAATGWAERLHNEQAAQYAPRKGLFGGHR